METPEEIDEVKPIKMTFKLKIDPLEEQLNAMRHNVMKKEINNRAIPVPTMAQINEAKKQNQYVEKIVKPPKALNKSNIVMDKAKINIEPIMFKNPNELTIDKINAGNKIANNIVKKQPVIPVVSARPIIPGMEPIIRPPIKPMPKIEINSIKLPQQKIVPINPHIPIVSMKVPLYSMPKISQMPTIDKGLTLTRKCRKCQH